MSRTQISKTFDVIVWMLLAIGGLNWGLIGVFNFNLVSSIFGTMTFLTRLVYTLVGVAAVYDIVAIKAIWKRWGMHYQPPVHA